MREERCKLDMHMAAEPVGGLENLEETTIGRTAKVVLLTTEERFHLEELIRISVVANPLRPVVRNHDVDRLCHLQNFENFMFSGMIHCP